MNREGMDIYSKEAYFNWLTSEVDATKTDASETDASEL